MAEARFKDYLSMYMGHLEEGDEADQLRQLLNTDREYREEFQNTDVAGLGIEAQDADLRNMNQEQDLDQFLPMRKEAVRAAMAEFGERMPSRSEDPRIHHNYLEKQWFDNREAERKRIRADPELNFKEEMEWWNTDEDIDWANLPRLSPSQSPEEQGAFDMVLQKDLRDLTSKELELRRHLEREREQQQQQPYERQDGGPLMEDYGTIEPYEPSPMEEQTQRIAEFLKRNGISNNASAQRQGENLSMLSEMIPGYGDIIGVREGIDMYQKGDRLGGGIMAVASMIPFIPGSLLAKQAIALVDKIRKLDLERTAKMRSLQTPDGFMQVTRAQKDAIDQAGNYDPILGREYGQEIKNLNNELHAMFDDVTPETVLPNTLTPRALANAEEIKKLKHKLNRERLNVSVDGDPALKRVGKLQDKITRLRKDTFVDITGKGGTARDWLGPAVADVGKPSAAETKRIRDLEMGNARKENQLLNNKKFWGRFDEKQKARLSTNRMDEIQEELSGELMPEKGLSMHDELQAAILQSRNESDNLPGIGEEELAAMQREVKKRLARQEGQNRLDDLKKEFGDY